jgi:hypothetical protein
MPRSNRPRNDERGSVTGLERGRWCVGGGHHGIANRWASRPVRVPSKPIDPIAAPCWRSPWGGVDRGSTGGAAPYALSREIMRRLHFVAEATELSAGAFCVARATCLPGDAGNAPTATAESARRALSVKEPRRFRISTRSPGAAGTCRHGEAPTLTVDVSAASDISSPRHVGRLRFNTVLARYSGFAASHALPSKPVKLKNGLFYWEIAAIPCVC